MTIRDLLPRDNVYMPLPGPTLRDALRSMVRDLERRGVLRNARRPSSSASTARPCATPPRSTSRPSPPWPGHSARKGINLLIRRRVRAVPVIGDKGEVLGLVADRDVVRALLPLPRADAERDADEPRAVTPQLSVRDVMNRSVLCVSEDLDLDEVVTTMVNKDLEVLPVVKDGALTGVVTRGEIVCKLFGP